MDNQHHPTPDATDPIGLDRRTALLGAAALLAGALGSARPAQAQEATPTTAGLPPGVALLELPQLTPFELPAAPGAVRVFWLLMEPNAAIPMHDHPFSEFAVMRSGTAMFLDEAGPAGGVIRGASAETGAAAEQGGPGVELTAAAGDVAIFPSGNRSDTRAGAEGAEMLILEIVTAAGDGTPTA